MFVLANYWLRAGSVQAESAQTLAKLEDMTNKWSAEVIHSLSTHYPLTIGLGNGAKEV